MDAKKFLEKVKTDHLVWFLLIGLFMTTLWIPQVREAHVLCARLILHLRGATFVQGNPPGCIIYTIPNVQFSEDRREFLRNRSTNSLEDYVLAWATGNWGKIKFPMMTSSIMNDSLLPWAAIMCANYSCQQYTSLMPTNVPPTNQMVLVVMNNAHSFVRSAQTISPTNGALWVVEAALDFTENKSAEALAALDMAASKSIWAGDTESTFRPVFEMYQVAGLSRLDATIEANSAASDLFLQMMQSKCSSHLDLLMASAIQGNNAAQFSRLMQLLFELRKAERQGLTDQTYNGFRRFSFRWETLKEMAKKIDKASLLEARDMSFERRQTVQKQIFEEYGMRHLEPRLVVGFMTQTEGYQTEKELRRKMSELQWKPRMILNGCASLFGILSIMALAAIFAVCVFEFSMMRLLKTAYQEGQLWRTKIIWTVIVPAFIGAALFADAIIGVGVNNEIGFGVPKPKPLINPNLAASLVALGVLFAIYGLVLLAWRKSETVRTHGRLTMISFGGYLISILLMALFRYLTVEALTPGRF